MRLSIDGGGYAAAATAFADANHTAALVHDSLCGKLGGYAAMAGDDTAAAEFATAYDAAATDAVHALADLVTALASLGRLTEQSLANHEEANLRSVIPGAVVYQGTDLPDAGYVSVLASTPPTSLGGDAPYLSDAENWILDHLGAVVWPNADTDRLHDAAHTWRTYAESVDRLADHCDTALANFERQRSPEIPLAVAATTDLRTTIRDLADQYAAIAGACDSYADHVSQKREELKALLREILNMVVEGVVISAAIGLISAGIGTLGGGFALTARIATQSPRFAAILTALRALTTSTAAHLRATQQAVHGVRARLDKFLRVPVRTDAGHFALLRGRWGPGFLAQHEGRGHTIARHVGLTMRQLEARFAEVPPPKLASTFSDPATAEREILRVVRQHGGAISAWTETRGRTLTLSGEAERTIGICLDRVGRLSDASRLRIVLERDPGMPDGFFIKTAYPTR